MEDPYRIVLRRNPAHCVELPVDRWDQPALLVDPLSEDCNFHHGSLQSRARHFEEALAMDLRDGIGGLRAAHALLLWPLFVR